MLPKFFKRKPKSAASEPPIDNDPLVVVPIPPMVTLLVDLERQKGAPLTHDEVLSARDGSVCMTMHRSQAWKLAE